MHDYSRDIMLATSQEQIEMRMALSAAEVKATALNSQVRFYKIDFFKGEDFIHYSLTQLSKLDDVQKKTDELLYQMMPKQVAARLR